MKMFWFKQSRLRWAVLAIVLALVASWGAAATAEEPQKEPSQKGEEPKDAKADDVAGAYEAYIKESTKENYLRAYRAFTTAKTYSPYSFDLEEISSLVNDEKYNEAQALLKKAMPGLLLNPKAHQLASQVAKQLGDTAAADREAAAAKKCLDGILGTGDGSAKNAYLVTRVSDEYDVLRHLGKSSGSQGLVMKDGKSFDKIQCRDGGELWFDVTALFQAESKKEK
jgi:hypothetical protein